MERFEGWILDLRGTPGGVEVWVKTLEGGVNRLTYSLRPSFFVYREGMNFSRLAGTLERNGGNVSVVEGVDFFSGDPVETLRVTAPSPAAFPFIRKCAGRAAGEGHLFSCDLPVEQVFFYETGTFPLCRCLYEMREGGEIGSIIPLEEGREREYKLPDLSVLHLAPVPPRGANPFQAPWAALELSCEGETFEVEWSQDGAFLENVNAVVRSFDPELIISEWGDEYVFPRLFELSGKTGIPLAFDRSEGTGKRGVPSRKGRSFFSYGQIIYRAPTVSFPGRVHLDGRNSFFYREVGLEGIIELSRISRIPLGRVARASPGTIISAMEMEYAWRRNILIPFKKRQSEAFKRADELVVSDKGGLVYMPPPGTFENVCELDFASMYPTLMVEYNISPETLLCSCCGERKVPETGTHTCVKRRGLIPSVLEPVVERRKWYKRMREGSTGKERRTYNARQTALKWILVVSFGFLGYRNARFGKIEAHEAVTAYGREMLLAAKEVAEEEGYIFLHGLTDALWIRKEGASSGDYQRLAERISTVTGMEIVVEGVYRWITFLPSKTRKGLAVPGKFVGVFESGLVKSRGISLRRRDTPPFVRRMQERMMDVASLCETLEEFKGCKEELEEVYRSFVMDLESGGVSPEDLSIRRRLSRPVGAYQRNTLTSQVVRELLGRGVEIKPGDRVRYVVTGDRREGEGERARSLGFFDGSHSPDCKWYRKLLREAAEEILHIFKTDNS